MYVCMYVRKWLSSWREIWDIGIMGLNEHWEGGGKRADRQTDR
jgi:hypothetical protein